MNDAFPPAYISPSKRFFSRMFGRELVALRDHSGEAKVATVWTDALGRRCASWFGLGYGNVVLLENGETRGASYVRAWTPIDQESA